MPQYRFVAAYNDARSRRMAIMHVTRAKTAGVEYEPIDVGRVYHELNGICGICRRLVPFGDFTVDHIMPISRGGSHRRTNLQIAHKACNSGKGNRINPTGF